jgi:hypothetical protein|tara:strand:+ start:327 stop:527 length:201 start_codon:yes stop_codon:yes gene_type:complete
MPGCNGKITIEYMQESNYYYYKCEKTEVDCSKKNTLSNDGLNPKEPNIIPYSDSDEWVTVETDDGL